MDDLARGIGASVDEVPSHTPSLKRGAELYQNECIGCHGETGTGDGAAGRALKPPPTNLTDVRALAGASPLSFYQRITIGTVLTAMPAYETRFPAADRWALALYATTLRQQPAAGDVPEALRDFGVVGRMTDSAVLAALGPEASLQRLAAVRALKEAPRSASVAPAVQGWSGSSARMATPVVASAMTRMMARLGARVMLTRVTLTL
jgi:hypothetical protein